MLREELHDDGFFKVIPKFNVPLKVHIPFFLSFLFVLYIAFVLISFALGIIWENRYILSGLLYDIRMKFGDKIL